MKTDIAEYYLQPNSTALKLCAKIFEYITVLYIYIYIYIYNIYIYIYIYIYMQSYF